VPERPLVVQYLYIHGPSEGFYYPSARSHGSAGRIAVRYLECAVAQAASLRLQYAACDLALATNSSTRSVLGREGRELLATLEELDVRILPTEYRHRPDDDSKVYMSSRYVLDAILAAIEGQPAERQVWLTDLDCIWVDPSLMFSAAPPEPQIGSIHIPYPPDWDVVGFGAVGLTRLEIGALAERMGGSGELPPWIGGELLGGSAGALAWLVSACEQLDQRLAKEEKVLPTEEQLLSLVGALHPGRLRDLSEVARRIQTGTRHAAPAPLNPTSLGLWHLPSEKGLSLRRAASAVRRHRTARLRRDLSEPTRAARRFNVEGAGRRRKLRDDIWIGTHQLYDGVRSALSRR
jgi:hypothetical protein